MGKIAITRCDWRRASSPCGSDDNVGSGEEAGSGNAAVPLCQHSVFAVYATGHTVSHFLAAGYTVGPLQHVSPPPLAVLQNLCLLASP